MKYKAIIFDIDGTAVPNGPEGMPSPRLIKAAAKADDNTRLIAATGRPVSYALPVIQALKLRDPCIISGGTLIIDPVSEKIMWEASLNQDQLDEVRRVCLPFPYALKLDNDDGVPAAERRLTGKANIIFIPKVESKDLTILIQQLNKIPGVLATSTASWVKGHVIHVTAQDGSKEHGVRHVLKQLGIKKDEAIGVGDGDNDIHLFAAVGRKIAMGNGSESLKAVADEIAPSVDEDGLAWVIEKYSK